MLEIFSKRLLMDGGKRLVDWTFPTLTANGTIGGNAYGVMMSRETLGPAYKITQPTNTSAVGCATNPPSYILFYSPVPVYIGTVYFYSINSWSSNRSATVTINIQGSNNNSQWDTLHTFTVTASIPDFGLQNRDTTITINSENTYKYIRLYCSASNKNVDPYYTNVKILGQMEI